MSNKNDTIEGKQSVLNGMKNETQTFLNLLIDNIKNSTYLNEIIKTEIFSVQISADSPDKKEENIRSAIENKLAFANFSNCEKLLKDHYNISQEINLMMKKVEFDPITDLKRANDTAASQGVSFDFFNQLTKEKLNTSICESAPTPISIPFKRSDRLNMQMYQKAQTVRTILDLYNSNSPGYHSRCFKTTQFDTGADVSLNYKRSMMFQNQTVSCSVGCTYEGLDKNTYVKCNCKTSGSKEMSNTGNDEQFDPLPKMNYDIVICYYETYSDVKFYLFLSL